MLHEHQFLPLNSSLRSPYVTQAIYIDMQAYPPSTIDNLPVSMSMSLEFGRNDAGYEQYLMYKVVFSKSKSETATCVQSTFVLTPTY